MDSLRREHRKHREFLDTDLEVMQKSKCKVQNCGIPEGWLFDASVKVKALSSKPKLKTKSFTFWFRTLSFKFFANFRRRGLSIKSYIPFSPQVCGGLVLYFLLHRYQLFWVCSCSHCIAVFSYFSIDTSTAERGSHRPVWSAAEHRSGGLNGYEEFVYSYAEQMNDSALNTL